MFQGPGRAAAEQHLIDAGVNRAAPQAPLERRTHVARRIKLVINPRFFEGFTKLDQFIVGPARLNGFKRRFGGQHPRLHRRMRPLDFRHIERSRFATDQSAAREDQLGQTLEAALVESTSAVSDPPAALEGAADFRMGLEPLKFIVRAQVRIFVVEADDKTDSHQIVFQVIQERSAVGVAIERPTGGVDHQALLMLGRFDFPEFLDADAVGLFLAFFEAELVFEHLTQMAAAAFREEGVFGMQFHARLVVGAGIAFAVEAHVAGRHAFNRTVVVVEHLGSGETGIDFNAHGFRLLAEPTAEVAQTDNVVALIMHGGRHGETGNAGRARLGEKHNFFITDRRVQGRALVLPVGD